MYIYELTTKDAGSVQHLHERTYPIANSMFEISNIIGSTDLSRAIRHTMLDGYLLVKPGQTHEMNDTLDGVYIYDLVIHPWRRGEGLSSWLLEHFFKETGKRGLDVFLNCRYTSYPIFNNPERLDRWGYKLVQDIFLKDFKQWDESANYLHLTRK